MILIIGYGNPLRGDDALGQVAAAYMAERFQDDTDVHVRAAHQLTPDLSEEIAAYETVILIDTRHRKPAGQVFIEDVQPVTHLAARTFSHYVTPAELVLLVNSLYGSTPRVVLAGISGMAFEVGATLSLPVRAALPLLYEQVIALVQAQQPHS